MKVEKKRPNQEFLHSCRHFFTSDLKNGHNLAILAPINLRYALFYSSRASDSDGIEIYHVRQNGHQLQLLRAHDTDKTQETKFIASYRVSSSIHTNDLYTKRKLIS